MKICLAYLIKNLIVDTQIFFLPLLHLFLETKKKEKKKGETGKKD